MKKIIVNEIGSYKIQLDDGRYVDKGKLYTADEKLGGKVNPAILDEFYDDEGFIASSVTIVPYKKPVPYTPSFEQSKTIKINELRELRDTPFQAGTILIDPNDVKRYLYLMIGTTEEINARLPRETSGGVLIETYEQMKQMIDLHDAHQSEYDARIQACKKANTQEQLDEI